jgi:hypothetical protein
MGEVNGHFSCSIENGRYKDPKIVKLFLESSQRTGCRQNSVRGGGRKRAPGVADEPRSSDACPSPCSGGSSPRDQGPNGEF